MLIPANVTPEEALNDNKRFVVVWTVLNALRAHDDRFSATVNKIELNRHKPAGGGSVLIGGIGDGSKDTDDRISGGDGKAKAVQLPLPQLKELQNAIYARMVQKVGNKRYWEQWAADVAKIAQGYSRRWTRNARDRLAFSSCKRRQNTRDRVERRKCVWFGCGWWGDALSGGTAHRV